jgi:hypothetical protein
MRGSFPRLFACSSLERYFRNAHGRHNDPLLCPQIDCREEENPCGRYTRSVPRASGFVKGLPTFAPPLTVLDGSRGTRRLGARSLWHDATACHPARLPCRLTSSSSDFCHAETHTVLFRLKQSTSPFSRGPRWGLPADLGRRCTSVSGKYVPRERPGTIHPPPADGRRETESRNRRKESVNTGRCQTTMARTASRAVSRRSLLRAFPLKQ